MNNTCNIHRILKIIVIVLIIIITLSFLNEHVPYKIGQVQRENVEKYIRIKIPNGYIGKSITTSNLLGQTVISTIYKDIGWTSVPICQRIDTFGLNTEGMSYCSLGNRIDKKLNPHCWENGYKKLRFFHPDIKYKEYKRDFKELESIKGNKIIEMGISLDKKYNLHDCRNLFKDYNISWLWINSYTNQNLDYYKKEVKRSNGKNGYMEEYRDIFGVRTEGQTKSYCDLKNTFHENYQGLLNRLKKYGPKDVYKYLKTNKDKPEFIGVILYGTKENLKTLANNPHVKGATIGVIRDNI